MSWHYQTSADPNKKNYALTGFTKSTWPLSQNWRGETKLFSIKLVFNFMHFPSKWFFGVRQDAVWHSRSHTQPSSPHWKHWFKGFLRYPVCNPGNSKWNWSKLWRLQAIQTSYYIQTLLWITSILTSWIINEFQNLGNWESVPGNQ